MRADIRGPNGPVSAEVKGVLISYKESVGRRNEIARDSIVVIFEGCLHRTSVSATYDVTQSGAAEVVVTRVVSLKRKRRERSRCQTRRTSSSVN